MDQTLTHRIRERAYQIWAASGCPEGKADLHWLAAEHEILTRSRPTIATPLPQAKKSRLSRTTKTSARLSS
ncbi:MAG: DUF2934 domain-containing protein [Xanthobacteraceae bacterium]